jgi:hypothetical protein
MLMRRVIQHQSENTWRCWIPRKKVNESEGTEGTSISINKRTFSIAVFVLSVSSSLKIACLSHCCKKSSHVFGIVFIHTYTSVHKHFSEIKIYLKNKIKAKEHNNRQIFPYSSESWILTKRDRKQINIFEV